VAVRRLSILLPLALGAAVLAAIALPRDPAPERVHPSVASVTVPPEAARTTALRRIALPTPPAPPAAIPASAADAVFRPTPVDAGRGRLLLAQVERGQGPAVEIAWPDGPDERRRLASHLTRCAGWQPMLLVDGRLWRIEDPAGRPWVPEPQARSSGILRDLEGPAVDAARMDAIRSRHGIAGGRPVATVDRGWDARLLGGLDRLIEAGGTAWGSVRGRYRTDGDRLMVTAVRVDGRLVPGQLDLGPIDLGPIDRGPIDLGPMTRCVG